MDQNALNNLITANGINDGETDDVYNARIAGLANADPRTVNPIPLTDTLGLRKYMNSAGLKSQLTRTVESSAFAAVVAGAGLTLVKASDLVLDALSWIFDGNNATLDTTDPGIAANTDSLLAISVAVNADPTLGMTQEQAAGMIALGDGYLLRGATTQNVADTRAAMAVTAAAATAQAAKDAKQAEMDSFANDYGRTVAMWDGVTLPVPDLKAAMAAYIAGGA